MIREYGYEYDAKLDKELWNRKKNQVTYEKLWGAVCLRSGRDALKVIAREYEPTIVLLPALACNSMVLPFEQYGHKVIFYKLTGSYKIDIKYLKSLISNMNQNILFLFMDYFGFSSISDEDLFSLCQKHSNLIFIEDRTHNLIWKSRRVFAADYVMVSLRKWTNIPDGGLLWAKKEIRNSEYLEDTSFSTQRLEAQCMRNEYLISGDLRIKDKFRRVFSSVSDIMDNDKNPSRMSAYSYEIAKRTNWDQIRRQRSENAERLLKILKESHVQIIQKETRISDLYVTFLVENRDKIQKKLSEIGIFNTIIWPLCELQKNTCGVAKYTEESMLAAPCDQRYTVEDMKYIGAEIVRVCNA